MIFVEKSKFLNLVMGKDVDELSIAELKKEVKHQRLMMWLWVVVSIFVLFGAIVLHRQNVACYNGEVLSSYQNLLSQCTSFTQGYNTSLLLL